jgi:peptidyl-prolyl cis-trans isomerase A (cyclophilin A)
MIRRRSLMLGAAALPVAGGAPLVTMVTQLGVIAIAVRVDRAPISGADFLRYVDAHAYDGGRFFRVVRADNDRRQPRINVVQGGTRPDAKVGAPVAHESTARTGLRHLDGTVSLTRDAPGTGSGSEFFICVGAVPGLDFGGTRNPDLQGYAAFGQVVRGMDVVRRMWVMDASGHSDDAVTQGQILRAPVGIVSAVRG